MKNQLTGFERQPEVPKPHVVKRELHIAQTRADNLRCVLRLSESIYSPPKTIDAQRETSKEARQ